MNFAAIAGELVDPPEVRTTQSGKAVTNLRIKTTRKWNGGESSSYWTVVLWEGLALQVEGLQVGAIVLASGDLANRKYTTRDGVDKWVTEIRAKEVEVVWDPAEGPSSSPSQYGDVDNVPF
tara:strand:+ start:351 stop:713 length:363 start_codon:yes stop_codon:yes gene_type:complete